MTTPDVDGDNEDEVGTWYMLRLDADNNATGIYASNDDLRMPRDVVVDGSGNITVFLEGESDVRGVRLDSDAGWSDTLTFDAPSGETSHAKLVSGTVDSAGNMYLTGGVHMLNPWGFGKGPIDVMLLPNPPRHAART